MDALKACVPHYVRCIKSNERKSAGLFDEEMIRKQVRYLGLVENVRVRRAGFAFRMHYPQFMHRFKMCCKETWPKFSGTPREATEKIIKSFGLDPAEIQFGHTKVFVKSPQTLFKMEDVREQVIEKLITKIQARWRAFLMRRWWLLVRAQAQDLIVGHKQRRQASLNRRYHGDYLGIKQRSDFQQVLKANGEGKILFADNMLKLRGPAFKEIPRALVLTEKVVAGGSSGCTRAHS
jgi:myosin I